MSLKCYFLIPAAGSGTRMGAGQPKLMRTVEGRPVILRTLDAIAEICRERYVGLDYRIILVTTEDLLGILKAMCAEYFADIKIIFTLGGNTRTESVSHGLNMINDAEDDDLVDLAQLAVGHEPLVGGAVEVAAAVAVVIVAIR